MSIFAYIYLAIFVLALLIGVLALIKNEVTFKNHGIINRAVLLYYLDKSDKAFKEAMENNKDFSECLKHEVDWDDIEDYNTTLLRVWDWGYTRLLPPEKFEIIKPYIEKAKEDIKNESTI